MMAGLIGKQGLFVEAIACRWAIIVVGIFQFREESSCWLPPSLAACPAPNEDRGTDFERYYCLLSTRT